MPVPNNNNNNNASGAYSLSESWRQTTVRFPILLILLRLYYVLLLTSDSFVCADVTLQCVQSKKYPAAMVYVDIC